MAEKDIRDKFKKIRTRWLRDTEKIHAEAERLHGVAAGPDQWSEEDRKVAGGKKLKKPFLVMNEILPIIDSMSGKQITQRFERGYIPLDRSFAALAQVWEELDRKITRMAHADQEESMAFRNGPNIAGVGWVSWGWDSIAQEIVVQEWPIWDVIWPAKSTRRINLQDRDGHIFGDWYTEDQFRATWGRAKLQKVKDEKGIGGTGFWPRSGKQPGESHAVPWSSERDGSDFTDEDRSDEDRIYVETWEQKTVEARYGVGVPKPVGDVVYQIDLGGRTYSIGTYEAALGLAAQGQDDPLQELKDLTEKDFDLLVKTHAEKTGEAFREDLSFVRPVDVYRQHRFAAAGRVHLDSGDIPVKSFTLLAITGSSYAHPGYTQWISTTERLEDAQKWKNVFLTQLVRYIQISPKGTIIAERGFFRSRGEAQSKISMMGGYVEVDPGKLSSGTPGYKIESGFDSPVTGMISQLMSYHDSAMTRLVGVNSASIGQLGPDLRRISGEVVRAMEQATISSNAQLFDAFALYRQQAGELLLQFVERFFEVDDVVRFVGDKAYQVDGATGQQVLLIPPKDQWDMAKFKVSVEDQTPDPDSSATLWKILSEQGAFVLQYLVSPHPITGVPVMMPEDLVKLLPGFPVYLQEELMAKVREQIQQMSASQPQEMGDGMPPEQ